MAQYSPNALPVVMPLTTKATVEVKMPLAPIEVRAAKILPFGTHPIIDWIFAANDPPAMPA